MTDWRKAYDDVRLCLERLVAHDRAAANREGLDGCIELQSAERMLDAQPPTQNEEYLLRDTGLGMEHRKKWSAPA